MAPAVKNYASLIHLLKKRGFLNLSKSDNNNSYDYNYGPIGSLFRHNILKQWWELMVNQQSNVFPCETVLHLNLYDKNNSDTSKKDAIQDLLVDDFKSKYLQILKLTNNRLPFTLATVTSCQAQIEHNSDESDLRTFFLGGTNKTRLLLQNFTIPTTRNNIFDYWLQLRLAWWKNFSSNPAHFEVCTNNGGSQEHQLSGNGASQKCMNIVYHFPWGKETLETVHGLGDLPFKDLHATELEKYKGVVVGKTLNLPHCIVCETSLESAAAAWLMDSYNERQVSGTVALDTSKPNMVLKLHPQICPYQVALAMSISSSSKVSEVRHVCQHLERDFKRNGVSLFNVSEQGSTLESHYRRNDQLGVQYTIVVMENTISDGILMVRHRDTQIQNTAHIGTLVNNIKRNLQANLEHS